MVQALIAVEQEAQLKLTTINLILIRLQVQVLQTAVEIIRPLRLGHNNGSVGITLGSGQSYNVGYANNDGVLVAANSAVKNSGNFASSITSTLALSLNTNGTTESRPKNVAMIYIIKT